jgi:iron complex outermembrane recepter protein
VDGLVAEERGGIEVGSPTRGYVRYKSTLAVDWLFRSFVTSLTLRYLTDLTEQCPQVLYDYEVESLCSDAGAGLNTMDERFYTDIQVSWSPSFFDNKTQFSIGINNVLDEDPPPCFSCDLNNYDGTIYPVPGMFVHARAEVKF